MTATNNFENETEFRFILNVTKKIEQPVNDEIAKLYLII